MTPLGGENRLVSAVANRLQSLGALTQGDRRAAGYSQDLVNFAIESEHGREALKQLFQIVQLEQPEEFPDFLELPEFSKLVQPQEVDQWVPDACGQLYAMRIDPRKHGCVSMYVCCAKVRCDIVCVWGA